MMEFHIARKARERYSFAESLFSYSGNVVFANAAACREFAYRINQVRDVERHPELTVHAGQLYAMGLIDEASHVLMARYRESFDPAVMTNALQWFSGIVGAEALGRMLLTFVEEFPGLAVMRGELTARKWLSGSTEGHSHWEVALEELLLLWTANRNEAFRPFEELFEEKTLAERTVYREVTRSFPEYFASRPLIPLPNAKAMNLLDLLRAPAVNAPRSLSEQLALIRSLWKPLLGDSLEHYLQIAADILHEEELAIWMQFNPPAVQASEAARRHRESGQKQWPSVVSTAQVPVFGDPAHEYEKFSPDMAWMPTATMIAKSTYVWLAQMSRRYGRAIQRLDQVPEEELAELAARGMNTLWLIGVWERSRASKTIKLLCGNSDAVASAYSLFDYAIAEDLGGEAAYVNLRDRAYHHGIRLASDMVPNHMGIDSPWVVEHPDWFIARQESPYPAYSFNGPDLSQDGRVEIKIEDHYYEESDAAVVFRRRDQQSGETRYIYHGNDGTSFPWNDTAQLDYLNAAVREQVIQTILHVARLFPVIRFDAAMTLAKRHFHRLWFPGPGASGAIPSRAEYGLSQAEFDQAMPQEFWREVVDRVAAEVPGTLLLAEAFWLMEGYFVRTLGMHRVYNSAFMVMLRDEDNAKYRDVIKKTIEFDPDILKRYVNFMSNPDERTAIDQFGKGDKCFGVATMMATLPGLPMFGHGQIEGFTEKYGMEYQRPRYDENADPWLVERHEREIAPLLKRRRLFAESDNFLLYDFYLDFGGVDENVFAYSNRNGGAKALVVFNNRYAQTRGTIDWSAAYADKGANQLRQQRVREGLGLGEKTGAILAWRDSLTGLQYLRRASDLAERGLTLELYAYQCHVFLDWQELYATAEMPWDRLCDQLNGRGVESLEDALIKLELQPAHNALRLLLEPGIVRLFADLAEHPRTVAIGANPEIEAERTAYFEDAWKRCESFLREAQKAYAGLTGEDAALTTNPGLLRVAYRERLRAAMRIPAIEALFPAPWTSAARRVLPSPSPQLTATAMWGPVLGWCALELLAESIDAEKPELVALDLFDRLRLREPFAQAFTALGYEGEEGWRIAARVKVVLLTGAGVGKPPITLEEAAPVLWPALWQDADVRWLTGVHEAEGRDYLVRESYEELLWWLLLPQLLRLAGESAPGRVAASRAAVRTMSEGIEDALKAVESVGYLVDRLAGPAVEEAVASESEIVPETAIELQPVAKEECEPAAAEIEGSADSLAQAESEPELAGSEAEMAIQEAPPIAEENPKLVEPELEVGPELVEEAAQPVEEPKVGIEAAVESVLEPEALEEEAPRLPVEEQGQTEAEMEPAAVAAVESVVESEQAEEAASPEQEAEPVIEDHAEAVSATESQTELAEEETAVAAEETPLTVAQPVEAETEAEAIAESVPEVKLIAELASFEPEIAAGEIPLPTEEPKPSETEAETGSEVIAKTEPAEATQPSLEVKPEPDEPKTETAADAESEEVEVDSTSNGLEQAERKIERAVESNPEAATEAEAALVEAETAAEETTLAVESVAPTESTDLENEREAEAVTGIEAEAVSSDEAVEGEPESEPAAAELEVAVEDQPSPAEVQEPAEPVIELKAESVFSSESEAEAAPVEATVEDDSLRVEDRGSTEEEIEPVIEVIPEAAFVPVWVEVEAEPLVLTAESTRDSVVSSSSLPEPPDDEAELMRWLLKPATSDEASPRGIHAVQPAPVEEQAEPEIKAEQDETAVKSLLSFYKKEPSLPQFEVEPKIASLPTAAEESQLPVTQSEPEPEPAMDVETETTAEAVDETVNEPVESEAEEEIPEEAEPEDESAETHPSGAKALVGSIASIFARKSAPYGEMTLLGLSDLTPSATESWEAPEQETQPAAKVEAEISPATAATPAFIEPFEPPAPAIEFTAKSAREVEAEDKWPAAAPASASGVRKPEEAENGPLDRPAVDTTSLLQPDRRKRER